MVVVNVVKGTLSGVVFAASTKLLTSNDMKESAIGGAIVGSSVVLTDAIFTIFSGVPQFFNVLGTYAADVVSSLIASVLLAFGNKYSSMIPKMGFFPALLFSLGSTVAGSYIEEPFKSKLPTIAGVQVG